MDQDEKKDLGKEKKKIKTSTGLIAIFAAVVIFFGGALTYWTYNDPNSYDNSADATLVTRSNTNSNANSNKNTNANINTNSARTTSDLTYTSLLGNFSFQVPDGYIISKSGGCEGLCSNLLTVSKQEKGVSYLDTAITIRVTDYQKSITLEDWNKSDAYAPVKELSPVKIGGVDAKNYENGGLFGVLDYRFVRGNFTYLISIEDRVGDSIPQTVIVNKIISTFQFTD